ncbi:MAG: hypothetical protein GQ525_06530 [Draconibacterium sp.]|nr:hypothetical protein [Draconibacterium sp.]
MKRNIIITLIILLTAVAGFIYFTKHEVLFSKDTSMHKAIPVSAPIFVELSALKSIPVDNPIVQDLIAMEKNILFLSKIALIDSLIQNNKEIQNSLRTESLIIAFDFVGESEIFPIIILKAENSTKQKLLEKFLSVLYPANKFSFSKKIYSNNEIITIKTNQDKNVLHFCFSDGLFISSPKLLLVEQSIRQLNSESISNNLFFSKVNKTVASQSKIAWYINHQTFPNLVALWLNNQSSTTTNEFGELIRINYKSKFSNFRNFAAWTELDVKLNDNELLFNGISIAEDSLNHYLSVFDGQQPVRFQADKILPKNTSFYNSFSFSDKALFFENLEKYFSHTDLYYKREDRIKKIESGFRINFKNTFQELVKNEIIVATTSIPAELSKKTTLFILQTKGKADTEIQLNILLNSYSKRKGVELSSLKSTFEIDVQTRFTIYSFPYPSFPGIWLGKPFGLAEAKFAAFYENYLVFSNSKKGLHEYLQNMVLESTLNKDIRYLKFKQNIASRANINSYININRIFSMNKDIFNRELATEFENLKENLQKFKVINWQVVCEKGISFNSVYLSFSNEIEEEAQTTWQSSIGSEIITKPYIVSNHRDKQNREVVLQDSENTISLVSQNGKVRWGVTIEEPILSKIHQIDYFRNGRLQYLFNTKNKLYLIDREGNNVAHFPVKFNSPATNGVSVFDYDNNRKYRYFVACENKKVVAYNNEGKVLTGWVFGKTDYQVTTPVQHFRVNNKDYIVFKDQSRIYIQNRKGETRVNSTAKFDNSKNPLILNLNGTPKIVATDKTGKVFYIYFDGKFTEKKITKFSENHFFTVADLNGNGVLNFVFIDGNELKVIDENGKKLFSKKFKTAIQHCPNIYSFSSKFKKIGITESSANRIYLFDPTGKLHEGFPLQGNSEFSIGKITRNSEHLNLIVGSRGGDLYNYTLN